MFNRATLFIIGAVIETVDPGVRDRPGAHRARLKRHPKITSIEPVAAKRLCRCPDRQYLGMGGRIVHRSRGIGGYSNDLLAEHDDRADRHLAILCGPASGIERSAHWGREREHPGVMRCYPIV